MYNSLSHVTQENGTFLLTPVLHYGYTTAFLCLSLQIYMGDNVNPDQVLHKNVNNVA